MGEIALIIKVGDQKGAVGKDYLCLKDGSIISIIDSSDPVWKGKTLNEIISEDTRRIFSVIEIDRSFLPIALESMEPIGLEIETDKDGFSYVKKPDPTKFKPRKMVFDLQVLANKIGDETLVEQWRGANSVPIQQCKNLAREDMKDGNLVPFESSIEDNNAVSSGSYNVGSGQTYTTLKAALADIANLTGNLTFTLTSDISETNDYTACAETLGGYTFKITSNLDHDGVMGDGNTSNVSGSGFFIYLSFEGAGTVEVEKMDINVTSGSTTDTTLVIEDVTTGWTAKIHDIVFDANVNQQGFAIKTNEANTTCSIYNCGAYGYNTKTFYTVALAAGSKMENCTARNSNGYGFDLNDLSNITVRNCASEGHGAVYADFVSTSNATGYNNASEDTSAQNANWGTGSGNITGIDDSDFSGTNWVITSASSLYGAGSNPAITGHTNYINGVSIVTGDVDIGCWGISRNGANNAILFGTNF